MAIHKELFEVVAYGESTGSTTQYFCSFEEAEQCALQVMQEFESMKRGVLFWKRLPSSGVVVITHQPSGDVMKEWTLMAEKLWVVSDTERGSDV
jgi:hypothetical protein